MSTMIEELINSLPDLRDDIEGEFQRVLDAVATTRDKGEVTLKIAFSPKGTGGRVDVTPTVSGKVPKEAPITGTFFITPEGRLSRRDSRQMDLEEALSRGRE